MAKRARRTSKSCKRFSQRKPEPKATVATISPAVKSRRAARKKKIPRSSSLFIRRLSQASQMSMTMKTRSATIEGMKGDQPISLAELQTSSKLARPAQRRKRLSRKLTACQNFGNDFQKDTSILKEYFPFSIMRRFFLSKRIDFVKICYFRLRTSLFL